MTESRKIKEEGEVEEDNRIFNEGTESDNHDLPDSMRFFTKLVGLSTEQTVRALNKKNKLDNVAIFVDYDNVYWTLMNNYSHNPDHEDPDKNLFIKLWGKYGQDSIRTFRAYADFEKVRTELTSLQKKRIQVRHVYSNGKNADNRKNSSDIELCIDAIEHTYKDPSITCYVFVTADSDMIPIISRLMYKNKHVELYYLSDAAPQHIDITSFVHDSEDLLTFLNVEVEKITADDYIQPSLLFIHDWHEKHKDDNLFLGLNWLRGRLSKEFSIPVRTASEIIEKLKVNDLVIEGRKSIVTADNEVEVKTSLTLTDSGKQQIGSLVSEVAATFSRSTNKLSR
ncbi:NYN domain-containing protein [Paenibacillus senegalensis]|uniref:NYN domain-containing protein n=1 Tax=Paenibacillus senegalensis TaxID=1465766 RepID=UPI0002884194|nr:NYN domain-containing protein [Paenibacillus senegalensis]